MTLGNGDDTIILEAAASPPVIRRALMISLGLSLGGLHVRGKLDPNFSEMTNDSRVYCLMPSTICAPGKQNATFRAERRERERERERGRERDRLREELDNGKRKRKKERKKKKRKK